MAVQPTNHGDKGSQRGDRNPYRDEEYQPDPGHWAAKYVREGRERDEVDWVTGRDIVS